MSRFIALVRKLTLTQDTAANDEEKEKAIDMLKEAKEAQKDDPVS